MDEGKYKKCFQDLLECQLFLEFPFNIFFFFHLFFFSKQYSVLPFNFSKFYKNSFYFLIFWHFPFLFFFFFFLFFFSQFFFFLLLWILAQTTTLKQTDQIPSWNTMDKGFKKERLIKRLNGVTRDNVSRKRKKKHIWLKVDKNGLISSLKDQYSSFNINNFKRFKCGIKSKFFFFFLSSLNSRTNQHIETNWSNSILKHYG